MLLLASLLATQAWAWDPVANATHYRVYYSTLPMTWCSTQYVEILATFCSPTECQIQVTGPVGNAIFFNVVAANADGESTWDHGTKVVCP